MHTSNPTTVIAPRRKAFVALYHGIDAARWAIQYQQGGRELDETPYGFHHAQKHGYEVIFASDKPRSTKVANFVTRVLGFDIQHAWFNEPRIRDADVIWTMTESEGFAIAFLMLLRLTPRKPIICNAVWLFNNWSSARAYKRYILTTLSRLISVMSVHSAACLPIARSAFPKLQVQLMHFGVKADLFCRASTNKDGPLHVISLGSDKTRDWETLLQAFGNDTRFRLSIVCWRLSKEDVAIYSNVTLVQPSGRSDLVELYREADLAVVPMVPNVFSGITAALEAASARVPLIATRTGGLPTYFDEDEVYFVPPRDPAAMRAAALSENETGRQVRANRALKRFITRDYSSDGLARRYCETSDQLLRSCAKSRIPLGEL